MGNQKLKWTTHEEEALKAGVAKHGAGKWKNILVDPQFAHTLAHRSNVDLKDKWRNMGVNVGQSSGDDVMIPKGRPRATGDVEHKNHESPALNSKGRSNGKAGKSSQKAKITPKYSEMILEAVSSTKDHNGSDFGAIIRFIEKKYEVPPNFRRLLSSKLRKLVIQGTLEKVQKRYKIKHPTADARKSISKQKEVKPKLSVQEKTRPISPEQVKIASQMAAQKIAEAENKSFLADEAVKDSEKIAQMAEDADSQLMHLKAILQRWSGKARLQMLLGGGNEQ